MAPSSNKWGTNSPRGGCRGTGKRDGFFDRHRNSERRRFDQRHAHQQDRRRARVSGEDRLLARRASDRVRQGHVARPLSAPGRKLSGPVRARRRGLCRRRRPRPARLRLYLEAVVHAGDSGAVQRRHWPRAPDQLLSQQRRRQPRRDRRDVERECVAGEPRRRHRHLLGSSARYRRAGRAQRQDQRHHPVRAGDGQPDARHFARARCAAARPPATSTSRTRRSRSSSKSANRRATSTARR